MAFEDPESSGDVVGERRVTGRTLAAAWCLALAAFIGLAAIPPLASLSRTLESAQSREARSADRQPAHQTVEAHEC
jgi:hypothetical protein